MIIKDITMQFKYSMITQRVDVSPSSTLSLLARSYSVETSSPQRRFCSERTAAYPLSSA